MTTDAAGKTDLEQPDPSEEEQEPGRSKFGLKNKQVKLFVLLLIVMTAEAAGFYLFIPAPTQSRGHSAGATSGEDGTEEPSALTSETAEVPIGTFNCTNSRANPGAVNHVTFSLVAIVDANQAVTFDKLANKQHKARIRQAVIKVVRSANLEDLDDPNLSAIRRLIREEINKVLRQSMVIEVAISEFTRMEQ